MKTGADRIEQDIALLKYGVAENTDDHHLAAAVVDVISLQSNVLNRFRLAEQEFVTADAWREFQAEQIALLGLASGIAWDVPMYAPSDAGDVDEETEQLAHLRDLLQRAVISDEPRASEIRRLVATILRVERQVQTKLLANGTYLDKVALDSLADDFARQIIEFSKSAGIEQEDWCLIVDKLIGNETEC